MILNRSASILHLYKLSSPPKLLFHLRRSYLSLTSSKSSSPSITCSFWFNESRTRQFTSSAVAPAADKRGSDTFYADERVSWTSLGLSDPISRAMSNAGFERPSLVQAASVPLILSGKDVIIAAETGSGKTHGYLVPLFERICTGPDCIENTTGQEYAPPHKFALVLCPNVLLCEQVVRMANGLCGDNGEPLLQAAAVGGRQGWPVQEPDVIVSTPVALLNNIEPNKRHFLHFMRAVKYVVFDEADMLLCGGYQNKVIRLLNLLRHSEKKLSQMNTSVLESPVESNSESLSQFDWEDKEVIGNDMDEEHSESDLEVESLAVETETTSSIKKMDWKRVRKHYERSKQYIFVAATLPVNGKRTAGAVLKRMFPDAKWVNGNFLHRHNPRLKERWVEVTFDTQVDALMEAVNKKYVSDGHYDGADSRCTMVFANTVEAVEAVAKILQSSGIKCYRYHKDSSLEERAKALVDFQEKGGVLVCTDAAARGIDIPNVSHIIQADFATSAVDFLHRVGRTARAGQYGLVTSLYTEANRELVDAIRQAWELGQPVETAFSRKRSFRNKLKKRGLSKVKDMSNTELAMA